MKSIDFNVDEFMCDVVIGSSLEPINMIGKTFREINEDILRLLFIQPQTYEISESQFIYILDSHHIRGNFDSKWDS